MDFKDKLILQKWKINWKFKRTVEKFSEKITDFITISKKKTNRQRNKQRASTAALIETLSDIFLCIYELSSDILLTMVCWPTSTGAANAQAQTDWLEGFLCVRTLPLELASIWD